MAQVFKIETIDDVANIEIYGDIGYIKEDEKENAIEKVNQLKSISSLKVDVINVTLESLGGSLTHALALNTELRQNGAQVNVYLRGYNASSSTVVAASAKKENIYMDKFGLYLIHKPMAEYYGNENDIDKTKLTLSKWKEVIIESYVNLGVDVDVVNDLLERNGGHGEWLSFKEAKEFGFVGNEWVTDKVSNYKTEDFTNKGLLAPKNIINQNSKIMQEQDKKGLFSEFKNWLKGEQEQEDAQTTIQNLKTENEQLKNDLATFKNKVDELEAAQVVEEVEEVTETTEVEEVAETTEASIEERIEAKVTEVIKNALNPDNVKKETQKNDANAPYWKRRVENFQNFKKLNK